MQQVPHDEVILPSLLESQYDSSALTTIQPLSKTEIF